MANQRPPWFKFDPSAFLADTQVDSMTTLELGACLRLLCRQWIDGDLPSDVPSLARLCRLDAASMGEAWVTLCHFFPDLGNGRRANRFMWFEREQVMAAMEKKSTDGALAARKRWDELRKNIDATPNGLPMPDPMQDKDKEEEKEVILIPTPSASVATRKKRGEAKKERMQGIDSEIVSMVSRLMKVWPTHRSDGSKVQNDDGAACVNVERIMDTTTGFTLEDLELAARNWVDTKPEFPNGIHFFFGPGKPGKVAPWKSEMKIFLTNKETA